MAWLFSVAARVKRPASILVALSVAVFTFIPASPAAAAACAGATVSFDGDDSNFWDDAGNWDTDTLPDANDLACIPEGESAIVRSGAAEAQNLEVSGTLRIEATGTFDTHNLTVENSGVFTLAGGTLDGNLASDTDAQLSAWGTIAGSLNFATSVYVGEPQGTTARTLNISDISAGDYRLIFDWLDNGGVAGVDHDLVNVTGDIFSGAGVLEVENPTATKLTEGDSFTPFTYASITCNDPTTALNGVPGVSLDIDVGATSATLTASGTATPTANGYWLATADGGVRSYNADSFGSMAGKQLNAPAVDLVAREGGDGYWFAAADGGVFAFGGAQFFGSMGSTPLNAPIVGMATTPDNGGYYLVAADGGVFAFGNAAFEGSTASTLLNERVVGIAADADGSRYWLAAADGGVFAFDAAFNGSAAAQSLNGPVVDVAGSPDGSGYWLAASDGGIFNYGAPFAGSAVGLRLNEDISSIAANSDGNGYRLAGLDGGVFSYHSAFYGSAVGTQMAMPTVAVASFGGDGGAGANQSEDVTAFC